MNQVAKREPEQTAEIVSADSKSLMEVISRAASDPNTDVTKLEKLMNLYERITSRTAEAAFNEAMKNAQTDMRPIAADSDNPQTKSKYASYNALDRAMRPIYTKHGFALSFNTGEGAPSDYIRVLCNVSHSDGFTREYHIDMPADGKGAKGGDVMTKTHAVGSGITYGTRYLLKMIFNISVGDDDDGNSAGSGEKINETQVEQLIELADEVGADKIKFCKYLRVDSIAAIPVAKFNEAKAALESKRK